MIPKECQHLARSTSRLRSIEALRSRKVDPAWAPVDAALVVCATAAGGWPGADGPVAARPLRRKLPGGVQGPGARAAESADVARHRGQDRSGAAPRAAEVHRRLCRLGQLGPSGLTGNQTRAPLTSSTVASLSRLVVGNRPSRHSPPGGSCPSGTRTWRIGTSPNSLPPVPSPSRAIHPQQKTIPRILRTQRHPWASNQI